jgi:uncharacterized protein (DUF885 family)
MKKQTSHFFLVFTLLILFQISCQNQNVVGETAVPQQTNNVTLSPLHPLTPSSSHSLDINTLHEQLFAAQLARNPEFATDLGVADHFQIGQSQLTNVSDAYLRETDAMLIDYLALLESIDPATLTPAQKLTNDILIWDLREQTRGMAFPYHDYIVNQLFSIPNDLPGFLAHIHPMDTVQDAEDYLSRLSQVDVQLAQVIEGLQIRADLGIIPPTFVFVRVLDQLPRLIAGQPRQHILVTNFEAKLAVLPLTDLEKQEMVNTVIDLVADTVYPAYYDLIDYLEQLQAQATEEDGVWKLPNGGDYYAYTLYHHTTTDLTVDEIHELGLDEVVRIQGEMQDLLASLGYDTNIPVGIGQIYRNAGGIQIGSDAARDDVFAAYENAMSAADDILAELFNIKPNAPLEIERVPEFREGSAPGAYYTSPPLDGSRPGIFFVNMPTGGYVSHVGIPTLAFHEGIPGHHFQKAIQSELQGVPTYRRAAHFSAFAEGWALYVEKLVAEYGYYENDPYGDYGRLQSELFRAVRLVVDTGIHAKQWTRQDAIKYMSDTLGWDEASVTAEVERYIVWPGQAASYKIGELTILRLREEARTSLGDAFVIAEFHTIILQNGDVPLEILEQIVNTWLKELQE